MGRCVVGVSQQVVIIQGRKDNSVQYLKLKIAYLPWNKRIQQIFECVVHPHFFRLRCVRSHLGGHCFLKVINPKVWSTVISLSNVVITRTYFS